MEACIVTSCFQVSGLPTFVNRLKVVGAASVTFARGSVTAVKPSVFHVDVENVAGDVNFNVKSFMIFGSGSGIKLTIKSIRKQVQVSGGFLSAPSGGSFTLGVVEVGNFVLNGNAFEVVDNVSFAGVTHSTAGFIFERTIFVQKGNCSPFLKLTPTL